MIAQKADISSQKILDPSSSDTISSDAKSHTHDLILEGYSLQLPARRFPTQTVEYPTRYVFGVFNVHGDIGIDQTLYTCIDDNC